MDTQHDRLSPPAPPQHIAASCGQAHAIVVISGVSSNLLRIFRNPATKRDRIHYSIHGSVRIEEQSDQSLIARRIPVINEILATSIMALPSGNPWLNGKIARQLLRDHTVLIGVESIFIDELESYIQEYYPEISTTRNERILAPIYTLHIAMRQAWKLIQNPKLSVEKKVVCLLPIAIAIEREIPFDMLLMNPAFKQFENSVLFSAILSTIDQEELSTDQLELLREIENIASRG